MFKRLLISSMSAVLRQPLDSGIQVCPPREGEASTRSRGGLRDWLTNTLPPMLGASTQRERGAGFGGARPLENARQDFVECLTDIRTQQAGDLLRRIRLARSLRELWFLRPEVFHLVAHHRDQAEANHRMAVLGSHFPRQVASTPAGRRGAARS
jgi:hypothetical protein